MRIIAGEWRGRPLVAPAGATTRPTGDRTREALFSMLFSRLGSLEGLAVADLFAGTGALGLEALSRGAAHCTFVEQDRIAIEALQANIATLKAEDRTEIRQQSATNTAVGGSFDLVLADPPYKTGFGQIALARLADAGAIAPGAWVSIETAAGEPVEVDGFALDAERIHGAARITLLRFEGK